MAHEIRPLADDDADASRRLRHEAFGSRLGEAPASVPRRGQHWLGAYVDGRLVGRVADRTYEAWFGGARIPTSGLAGATIQQEHRGTPGLFGDLFTAVLRAAKQRGAVVSTMFPTAVGIYRRHGFERITEKQTVRLSMGSLASLRRPDGIRLRRAEAADVPAVRALYEDWAARHQGALSRTGVHFERPDERLVSSFTGITVAEDEDGICAYASWDRSPGHTPESYLAVSELVFSRPAGARALLAMLGTNGPVVGYLKLDTYLGDSVRMLLASNEWQVLDADVYGLKVLDVARALELRRWAPGLRCTVPFRVTDDVLTENEGGWLLEVADGQAHVTRSEVGDALELTSRGLAVAYAGALPVAELRALGQAGGDTRHDAILSAALGERRPAIRDYF